MADRIDPQPQQPSPLTALQTEAVVNLDSNGSFWGTNTAEETEADIAQERAKGSAINEWSVADREGQPLRIADPTFLDTICVIPGPARTAVAA